MTKEEFYEELRHDAYMEECQNIQHDVDMRDFDYFCDYFEVSDLVDTLSQLKKSCEEYGHDLSEVLGGIV